MSLVTGGCHQINMRRTAQDRREAREALTAVLMGDPAPDRFERAEARRERLGSQTRNAVGPRIREQ